MRSNSILPASFQQSVSVAVAGCNVAVSIVTLPQRVGAAMASWVSPLAKASWCACSVPYLALDFRFGALPLPFSGHSISFARLPVLLFSGHLPVFPPENAFSNNFQKNAAFWKNPENIWLKFGQNSAKFWEILQNFVKISEMFSDF